MVTVLNARGLLFSTQLFNPYYNYNLNSSKLMLVAHSRGLI